MNKSIKVAYVVLVCSAVVMSTLAAALWLTIAVT